MIWFWVIYLFVAALVAIHDAGIAYEHTSASSLDSEDWFCAIVLGLFWPFSVFIPRPKDR